MKLTNKNMSGKGQPTGSYINSDNATKVWAIVRDGKPWAVVMFEPDKEWLSPRGLECKEAYLIIKEK